MRILRINNEICDIDEKTIIGIDFQAYDISDPANQKTKITNKFTIPKTDRNLRLIKFTGNPHSIDDFAYNKNIIDYWEDNVQLIKSGIFYISEIQDRISIIISEKSDIWKQLAELTWNQFLYDFMQWAVDVYPIGSYQYQLTNTYKNIIDYFASHNDTPFILSLYNGNIVQETTNSIYLKRKTSSEDLNVQGGHFSIYISEIFKYLEYRYSFDFGTNKEDERSIFNDVIASEMYVPARRININFTKNGDNYDWYMLYDDTGDFLPSDTLEDKREKNMFEIVKSFFQHFNIIMKPTINGCQLYRFDTINTAEIIDFSDNIIDVISFSPIVDNYKQMNYISWSSVEDENNKLLNSKLIECDNDNIEKLQTLFEIEGYISKQRDGVLDLSTENSFNTFEFLINGDTINTTVNSWCNIGYDYGNIINCQSFLHKASYYSLESEYNFLEQIVSKPKKYIIKKRFELLYDFDFTKRYRIIHRDINGLFYVIKISGYNPTTKEANIELLKI